MRKSKDLRIKRSVTILGHSPDVVELRSGVWNAESYTLTDHAESGKLFNLVSSLGGTSSRSEIAKNEGVPRADVEALIDHLDQLGLIEDAPTSALDAYLDRIDTLASGGEAQPLEMPVFVLGDAELGEAIAAQVDDALGAGKARVVAADSPVWRMLLDLESAGAADALASSEAVAAAEEWRGGLVVLAETVINPLRFRSLNRVAHELGTPWLHAAIDGPFMFAGPTVLPRRSACYECFETRVMMNLRESAGYQRYKTALARGAVHSGEQPLLGSLRSLLASHVALEVINYAHTGSAFTVEKVLSIYLPTMEIAYHEILRLPGCSTCGSIAERDDSSLYFDARVWIGE